MGWYPSSNLEPGAGLSKSCFQPNEDATAVSALRP